ncbi:MAG TPA: caspase family protein, partial [Ktedonobacterales bacterium]|nr:caspase family protein [Ktedonobacterales bacterium]
MTVAGAPLPTPPRPPRHVALLIGIGDYKYFEPPPGPPGQTDLSGPPNDVPRMRFTLRRYGFDGDSNVRVLRDAAASRQGIADGFRWLAERATDSADVVVVFYSGHGSRTRDANGDEALVTPGDTLDEALVPWDAKDVYD